MNQQAARESRKELRRAIGTQAIADLDYLTDMLVKHEQKFKAMDAVRADEYDQFTKWVERVRVLEDDYWRDHAHRSKPTTLWTRFRVLLTGH